MNEFEPSQPAWAEYAKLFGILLLPFTLLWKYIDKSFNERKEERVALISDVAKKTAEATVKETLKEFMSPLQDQIKETNKKMDDGFREIHHRIDEMLKK